MSDLLFWQPVTVLYIVLLDLFYVVAQLAKLID